MQLTDQTLYETARTLVYTKDVYSADSTRMAAMNRAIAEDTNYLLEHMSEGEVIPISKSKQVVKKEGKIITKYV